MFNFNVTKLTHFAEYCGDLWCEWHSISIDKSSMEIHIISDCSKWIIHLKDYNQFHGYILWHYSNGTENQYHKQRRYNSIYNAIAAAYAHDFHKKYDIDFSREDLQRLRKDFDRYDQL